MNHYKQLVQKIVKNKHLYNYPNSQISVILSKKYDDTMICFDHNTGEVYCISKNDFIQYVSLYFVIESNPLDGFIQYDFISNKLWFASMHELKLEYLFDIGLRLGVLKYLESNLYLKLDYNSIDFSYIYKTMVSYYNDICKERFQNEVDSIRYTFPPYASINKIILINWANIVTYSRILSIPRLGSISLLLLLFNDGIKLANEIPETQTIEIVF